MTTESIPTPPPSHGEDANHPVSITPNDQASDAPSQPEADAEQDASPETRFADLALPEQVLAALEEDGYATPSPIQAAIIPHLLDGRDVIGQAQTGTGKTAAFALPILAQLDAANQNFQTSGHDKPKGPTALILAPTRELAIQVADAFAKYARRMKRINVLSVYGGADFRSQEIALRRGVDVVVGTPGRVMDHMRRKTLDVSNIQTLVLDEADEMLRMGFVDDVEWVLSETPPGRQVALFSATMPGAIKAIAEKQLNNPERIRIQGQTKTADTVRQRYWRVQGVGKVEALCRLLAVEPFDAAIVFVRTRAATGELARLLEDAGHPAAALSGDVPQSQRERTIDALRSGRLKLVVATDVAARGIDVQSITHVFNFDVPVDAEAYIHRIGRTGRAGREGQAVLFVENRQKRLLDNIERVTGQTIEKMELPTKADVHALRLERFGDKLKSRILEKSNPDKPTALRGFIEDICEATGRDAADVAAFLVGPAMNTALGGSAPTPNVKPQRPERNERPSYADRHSYNDRAPSNDRPDRPRPERPSRVDRPAALPPFDGKSKLYQVAVGKADGIGAGHLVGAIANEAGLDGADINRIQLFDRHSTLELPANMPPQVFQALQRITVLGKPLNIRTAPGHTSGDQAQNPSSPKPHFTPKAKFKPKRDTVAPAATPHAKSKFKPKHPFKAKDTNAGKPFKKFKFGTKPKPDAQSSDHGNNSQKSAGHSLAPVPFAGGKGKPKRYNKPAHLKKR